MKEKEFTKIQVTIDVEPSDELIRETALFNLTRQSPGTEISDADIEGVVGLMKSNRDFAALEFERSVMFLANVGREQLKSAGLYPQYRSAGLAKK